MTAGPGAERKEHDMTIEMFLTAVFKVSTAIVFIAFCFAGVSVCVYYSYKMAESMITKRKRYITRIRKSRAFNFSKPELTVFPTVEKNGKRAQAK
jgi:hypothetical protein